MELSESSLGGVSAESDARLTGSFWTYVRAYVRKHILFDVGLAIVAVALFLSLFGPLIAPYDPVQADPAAVSQAPSREHWFGTDSSGMDVFSRVIAAPRVDISIAVTATVLSLVIGSLVGLLVSYFEGRVGGFVMRFSDVVQAFPLFVLAMVLVVSAGRNISSVVVVIGILNVPIFIRLMRSQVLSMKHRAFVEAARALGNRELRIAFRHVLPNCLEPVLIQASVTIGFAITHTAGLSFLGAGVRPPTPEWGSMVANGAETIALGQWWASAFPGMAIAIVVFGFAVVGEGLQEVLRGKT